MAAHRKGMTGLADAMLNINLQKADDGSSAVARKEQMAWCQVHSVHLLYKYKSTNTHFTCFASTKVQILTLRSCVQLMEYPDPLHWAAGTSAMHA
jgi:hypothetical protein